MVSAEGIEPSTYWLREGRLFSTISGSFCFLGSTGIFHFCVLHSGQILGRRRARCFHSCLQRSHLFNLTSIVLVNTAMHRTLRLYV